MPGDRTLLLGPVSQNAELPDAKCVEITVRGEQRGMILTTRCHLDADMTRLGSFLVFTMGSEHIWAR